MRFYYKAKTKEGKVQSGIVEAESKQIAFDTLEKHQLFVVSLRKVNKLDKFLEKLKGSLGGLPLKELTFFARQFSIMLSAGVSPLEALRVQVSQLKNPDFRQKILAISQAVERGTLLSRAFSLYRETFGPFFISMIKSGEATGRLAESLDYLADYLERDYNLRQKVKSAMIYPIFVIFVFIVVFFFASFFIMPKLQETFKAFEKVPKITKLMFSLTDFFRKGGWLIFFLLAISLLIAFFQLRKRERFKRFYDKFILKIPIFGDFQKKSALVKISENLSVLIKSGLPISQVLQILIEVIGNYEFKKVLKETKKRVERGETISRTFYRYPKIIPPFLSQMIESGEKTGELSKVLTATSRFYRQELERKTEALTSILEPILILVLGGAVGFLVVSIFIPIFKAGLGGAGL